MYTEFNRAEEFIVKQIKGELMRALREEKGLVMSLISQASNSTLTLKQDIVDLLDKRDYLDQVMVKVSESKSLKELFDIEIPKYL